MPSTKNLAAVATLINGGFRQWPEGGNQQRELVLKFVNRELSEAQEARIAVPRHVITSLITPLVQCRRCVENPDETKAPTPDQHERYSTAQRGEFARAQDRKELREEQPDGQWPTEILCSQRTACTNPACEGEELSPPRPLGKLAVIYDRDWSKTARFCVSSCPKCGADSSF